MPSSLTSNTTHSKCQGGILNRKPHKRSRNISSIFGQREARHSLNTYMQPLPSSITAPFRLSPSPPIMSSLLPSTPNAFHLSSSVRCAEPTKSEHSSSSIRRAQSEYQEAFGHLRRSIEDGDQRFIQLMQEWEQQHAAPQFESDKSNRDLTPLQGDSPKSSFDDLRFDDDEVEIIVHSDISLCTATRTSREELLDSMDQDLPPNSPSLQHKTSYNSFAEDDLMLDESASASQYSSSNFSNGFPSSSSWGEFSSSSSMASLAPPGLSTQTQLQSKSDRAIAALSLALANGAADLQDYHSILQAQGSIPGCDAGSLWD